MSVKIDIGRVKRQRDRTRSPRELRDLLEKFAFGRAPWLVDGRDAPTRIAAGEVASLRLDLGEQARTRDEAAQLDRLLREMVDNWNAAHPGCEVGVEGAVAMISAPAPAWTPERLADLRRIRPLWMAFEARCEELRDGDGTGAEKLPGLLLASAVFDCGCLSAGDLAVFAQWLSQPDAVLHHASAFPVWIDLLHRNRPARGRRRAVRLPAVSGMDETGPFALRRLFLDRRMLDLLAQAQRSHTDLRGLARNSTRSGALFSIICDSLGPLDDPPRDLRALLSGATALLETRPDGPDHTTARLAARRMRTFGFTPASWMAAIGAPGSGTLADAEGADAGGILDLNPPSAETPPTGEILDRTWFVSLQGAVYPPRSARADMTSDDRKMSPTMLVRRLHTLPDQQNWPDCLRLLRDWYLDLLTVQRLGTRSVQRYHSTLAAAFCAGAGDAALTGLPPEDFDELYSCIIEADSRSPREKNNLRHRLRLLHGYGVQSEGWNLPEIDMEILGGEGDQPHIRAVGLSHDQIRTARDLIRQDPALSPETARAADAAFLFMSRTGLRIGEVTKAMLEHLEAPDRRDVEAVLFVRPSRFGDNKTPNAYRQIRPFVLLNAAEKTDIAVWLAHRRLISPLGPLFGVQQPNGQVAPFKATALADLFARVLRQISGTDEPSAHSLRRFAINNAYLAISERYSPASRRDRIPESILLHQTGWSVEERTAVADAIAPPARKRERWQALSRFCGHGDVGTTLETYVGLVDLEIFRRCSTHGLDEAYARSLFRLENRIRTVSPRPESPLARAEIRRQSLDAGSCLKALEILDAGAGVAVAADAALLREEDLRYRIAIAQSWSCLKTTKGKSRLQSEDRQDRLAPMPVEPARRAKALEMADRLSALFQKEPDRVTDWIRLILTRTSQTNTGVRLRDPSELRFWLSLATHLRPAQEWLAELVIPEHAGQEVWRDWSGMRPMSMKRKITRSKNGKSVIARMRLLTETAPVSGPWRPEHSCDGVVRFAAHLAAVLLMLPAGPGAGGMIEHRPLRYFNDDFP